MQPGSASLGFTAREPQLRSYSSSASCRAASAGVRIVFQAPVGIRRLAASSRTTLIGSSRVDALDPLPQHVPQHRDAGVGGAEIFERVHRDRALALLRFEIVGFALALLIAAHQLRARPDIGDRIGAGLPLLPPPAVFERPGDDADAAHMLVVDWHRPG
jgi:hypothetical protein